VRLCWWHIPERADSLANWSNRDRCGAESHPRIRDTE
jgi:hypothetical protein